jgi:glycosyltransferase involved in cell wall biosynthesis
MSKPTLCHIFEATGPYNAIGKVATGNIRIALDAGYKVTVVAKRLDESLQPHVEWLKLYVPSRLFFVQWTTARAFIKSAIGNRSFDIIHGHQPQIASLCDVFQCHFLTRAAYERNCLEERTTLRARFVRLQQQGVLHAEDHYYRRWNPTTRMLYDSELTKTEFHRLYGKLPREGVLVYDFPPLNFATADDRRSVRQQFIGHEEKRLVVGYLGGLQERKGYKRLLDAIAADSSLFLLMGGSYTDGFSDPRLAGRMKSVGMVGDPPAFYAACDVLVVPSLFEPLGLVAFEAAARGIPVIATDEVGALPHLLAHNAGFRWNPAEPLGPIVRHAVDSLPSIRTGIIGLEHELSMANYRSHLLGVYDQIRNEKNAKHPATPTREPIALAAK